MKRIRQILLALAVLWMSAGTAFAQSSATEGLVFWMAFMKNSSKVALDVEHGIVIAAKRTTNVTISVPGTTWSHSLTVAANSTQTYHIPTAANVYLDQSSTQPVRKGVRIVASDTVSVSAYSSSPTCLDATSVLPEQSLGTEYMVHTQTPMQHGEYAAKAHFAIVATEDGTQVTITPSNDILLSDNTHNSAPITVTMQEGEVVYLESAYCNAINGNLSGTMVVAGDCKKVAVFNGNDIKAMPRVQTEWTGDVLLEQAYPLNSYGREFIVTASLTRCADVVRITAAADNDSVYIDGVFDTLLQLGQSVEWYSTTAVSHITTSKPSACHLYLTSAAYCTPSYSDPAMVWIPPVEQSINNALFSTISPGNSPAYNIEHDYLNVVVKTADVGTARLDNVPLTGFAIVPNTNNVYSYCRVPLTTGSHRLHVGGDGFVAHVYGMGYSISYAYLAGSGLVPTWIGPGAQITATGSFCPNSPITLEVTGYNANDIGWGHGDNTSQMGVNQHTHTYHAPGRYTVSATLPNVGCLPSATIRQDIFIHTPQTIHVNHVIDPGDTIVIDGQSYVVWSDTMVTENGTSAVGCDSTTIHHISAHSIGGRLDTVLCDGASIDYYGSLIADSGTYFHTYTNDRGVAVTDTLIVVQGSSTHQTIDTILCQGTPLSWNGHLYTAEGAYNDTIATALGCDSITTIQLHLAVPSIGILDTTLCPGEVLVVDGSVYNVGGTYSATLTAASGCDSNLTIQLGFYPAAHSEVYDTIRHDNGIIFNGQYLHLPGTYYAHLTSIHGCDSLVTLFLASDPATIWFPNIITPGQPDNQYFQAFGQYILEIDIFIYNRNGEKVAELHGMDDRWDGTHKGALCPEGAYAYRARYRTADHPARLINVIGTVLIVR